LQIFISKKPELENKRTAAHEGKNTVKRAKLNHHSNNNGHRTNDKIIEILSKSVEKLSLSMTTKKANNNPSYVNIQSKSNESDDALFQLTTQFQSMHLQ